MRFSPAALAVALAHASSACAPPARTERPAAVNQEPVAMLTLPAEGQAFVELSAAIDGSLDVDGTVTHAALTWGDDTPAEDLAFASGAVATHTYTLAGLYDVQLALTDDDGLVGRARTRVRVAPPPDAYAPVLESLTVTRDAAPVMDGARVPVGTTVDVTVRASDADGHLDSATVEAGDDASSMALAGADATGTLALALADAGDIVIVATARDTFGNLSPPASLALTVLALDADTDGDGLPDIDDPDPERFNGLNAELFAIEGIGEDLLGNQRAETVVQSLATAPLLASFTVAAVDFDVPSSSLPLVSLADHEGDVSELFALRYRGVLIAPPGADHVVIEITADDVGVVFIDAVAVASADREYAADFLRFNRAPAESEPVALPAGLQVPIEIVVGNGTGAYGWSIRFRFLGGDTTIMNPEAVSQRQFSVQE
jgi:hypothetical protein